MKISGIYKITNVETNEFYIGSSVDIKRRWIYHKAPSSWKQNPNKKLYIDFQQYGLDKFKFEIVEETEKNLKEREQYWIDLLKPSYNNARAFGWDLERYRKTMKKRQKEYHKTEKYKEYHKEYQKTKKYKECQKEYYKNSNNRLCNYNGETLTLCALRARFSKKGIEHPQLEAKKYLFQQIE